MGDLFKDGVVLQTHFKQLGAGKNIVGMHYTLAGVTGFYMSDPLTRTPQELAEGIDSAVTSSSELRARAARPAAPSRSGTAEDQAAADAALAMAAGVVAQLGGTFTADGFAGEGTAGAWSYGNAEVSGITVRLAASGGGVVQVNGDPFDADRKAIVTPEQVKEVILAAAPAPASDGDSQAPMRAWQAADAAETDPGAGAATIKEWDAAKADALMANGSQGVTDSSPEGKARAFIGQHLQGRIVKTSIGDCLINAVSKGKLPSASGRQGSIKVAAIARLSQVLIEGQVGKSEALYKARDDGIDGFYPFTHKLDLGAYTASVRVKVGRRQHAPTLVYSLEAWRGVLDSIAEAEKGGPPIARRVVDTNVAVDLGSRGASGAIMDGAENDVNDDGLNLEILAVWDAAGNLLLAFTDTAAEPVRFEHDLLAASSEGNAGGAAAVDAAYQFASATDAFKEWLAESIAEPHYSPFASAKAMDEAAKGAGLAIACDVVTEPLLDGTDEAKEDIGFAHASDAEDEQEDTDPEAELDATPDGEDENVLDGDFAGHPFRGNQYRKASRASGSAVESSMRAERAERKGDKKAASAHRSAYHAHSAAAEDATGKAKDYHAKMARFHGKRGGVKVLDDASGAHWLDESENWHAKTMKAMARKSDASLRFIIKDATDAAAIAEKMDNPKAGQ